MLLDAELILKMLKRLLILIYPLKLQNIIIELVERLESAMRAERSAFMTQFAIRPLPDDFVKVKKLFFLIFFFNFRFLVLGTSGQKIPDFLKEEGLFMHDMPFLESQELGLHEDPKPFDPDEDW